MSRPKEPNETRSRGGDGDQVRITVLVSVERDVAFRVFTEEIDQWWRRGVKFRASGRSPGVLRIEPRVGGRLVETFESASGPCEVVTGQVTVWEPPTRLAFEWRGVNFAPHETTEVEVSFAPSPSGTLVTLTHRGWRQIRRDHPARHGLGPREFCRMLATWWSELLASLREHAVK